MKHIFITLIICCSLAGCIQKTDTATQTDSIQTEIFLDSELLNQLSIDEKFIGSIEYTPEGFVLLSSANRFYLLGIGGIAPVFENWNNKNEIASFTITSDSILVVVSGNALYQLHSDSSFIKILDIPNSNMGITSKYENAYVYDRTLKSGKKNYSIYQISREGKVTPLLTINTPILSVFESASVLIFSTQNTPSCVDIKTKKMFNILSLAQDDNIISIAGDTIHHVFYFSTDKAVYRIRNNQTELVSDEFGGILKYDGEGLLIFNPNENLIVRFRNNILYDEVNL